MGFVYLILLIMKWFIFIFECLFFKYGKKVNFFLVVLNGGSFFIRVLYMIVFDCYSGWGGGRYWCLMDVER